MNDNCLRLYRSALIDGDFRIEAGQPHGTVVTCTIANKEAKEGKA